MHWANKKVIFSSDLVCRTGSQPRASEPMKVQFDMPSTGFWSVPETSPETLIESSGDPVLDSLRLQLKKHGTANLLKVLIRIL